MDACRILTGPPTAAASTDTLPAALDRHLRREPVWLRAATNLRRPVFATALVASVSALTNVVGPSAAPAGCCTADLNGTTDSHTPSLTS